MTDAGITPPAVVMGLLANTVPPQHRRIKMAERARHSGVLDQAPRRWGLALGAVSLGGVRTGNRNTIRDTRGAHP